MPGLVHGRGVQFPPFRMRRHNGRPAGDHGLALIHESALLEGLSVSWGNPLSSSLVAIPLARCAAAPGERFACRISGVSG